MLPFISEVLDSLSFLSFDSPYSFFLAFMPDYDWDRKMYLELYIVRIR